MSAWSHIIVEGYCTFGWESKKEWKTIEWKTNKKGTIENKHYIPRTERPGWCKKENRKRIPNFRCLCDRNDNRCPFFAMVNVTKKEYRIFFEGWKKTVQEENERSKKD